MLFALRNNNNNNNNKRVCFRGAGDRVSRRTVKILCAWTWLYALTWALLPLVGWGRYGPEAFGLSCSLAWVWMKADGFAFVVSMFTLNLALPALVILLCYFGISCKLYATYRKSSHRGLQVPNIVRMHRRLLIVSPTWGF